MKSQSSIEFLSTYGFIFLVIGIAVALIFFVASYNGKITSAQCTAFGGLNCNFVGYYPNATYGYSMVTMSISNAQASPIHITSINITVDGISAEGICAPGFLYQDQEATCIAALSGNTLQTSAHTGTYSIGAGFCVSSGNDISSSGCNYLPSNYTGSFNVYSAGNDTTPFSVAVAYVPGNVQLPALPSSPTIPSNYLIVQNGDMVPSRNLTGFKYAFGTPKYLSDTYFSTNVVAYPSILSVLNSNTIPCAPPYQPVESVAYSAFYMPGSNMVSFQAYSDNAIEIYYKQSSWGNWVNAFSGKGWTTLPNIGTLLSSKNTLSAGYYQIAVDYVNVCGDGMQAVSVNGIGQ